MMPENREWEERKGDADEVVWGSPGKTVNFDSYLGREVKTASYGPMTRHWFELDGQRVWCRGYSVLNRRLSDRDIGRPVQIEYTGTRISANGHPNPTKLFKISFPKEKAAPSAEMTSLFDLPDRANAGDEVVPF
ncbi:MAG TPA: hypothetical protein VKV57_04230 [bacterium]|nr:hypothetical protein [bacterium]